jgi:outer membrane protein assembly factor BamB
MKTPIPQLIVMALLMTCAPSLRAQPHWTEFRGSRGDGHADASNLVTTWGEASHVRWKTPIHGKGWSSPVIWNNQIWLTTASEDGKQMFAICIDRTTGNIVRDALVFENAEPRFCHPTNSYASPTPAIEDGRVYVHFGSYGTACLDTATGKKLWQRRDFPCNHWRGPGASPILYDGCLFVPFDGFDVQYVVALDTQSGATVWRKERNIDYGSDNGDYRKAYCTCSVIEHDGRTQLISPSAAETISYDPKTGDELWRVRHGGMNAATRPIYADGLVYVTNGDSVGRVKPSLLAIRPDGNGVVSDTHVVWTQTQSVPRRPSQIVVDDLLFLVSDDGIAACLDAGTGEIIWRKRLGGGFRASPIYSNGYLYFFNLDGEGWVIRAAREFELVASNQLDNGCQASPAVSGNDLFVRTTKHLYCLGADHE